MTSYYQLLSNQNYIKGHFLRASLVMKGYVGGLETGESFCGSDLTNFWVLTRFYSGRLNHLWLNSGWKFFLLPTSGLPAVHKKSSVLAELEM